MTLATSAVAVMLPVEDVGRATEFYVEKLGLDCTGTNGEGSAMFTLAGGTPLLLLPRPGAPRSTATALSWEVEDVSAEVRELEARGVTFQDYDLPGLKTVDHVCELDSERAAWFSDPDGNMLCLHERTG